MRKFLLSLVFIITAIAAHAQDPAVTMTTTTTIGSTFSFYIVATADNTPIQVDWGNGTLANYTIGTSYTNLSGALAGNTIKIYGEGITYLNLSNRKLTSLDVTKNTALTKLDCTSNQLTAVDVTKNTALISLNFHTNRLTALDVTKNTALINLDFYSNQLTVIDVTQNTSLTELTCASNQLTDLDVTNNNALTVLWCSSNQLTAIDVTKNAALTQLNCASNIFTFTTLPIKQATWTTYNYSPQAKIALAKKEYSINEDIDLSSQLTAGGNTTTYVWKTIGGITLVKDVDYTESNGKFTFKAPPVGYFYCEMKNATFPDLTLTTENIFITPTTPAIIMTTANSVGTALSFELAANENNNSIHIDWGNGVLYNYTIQSNWTSVSGTLTGNTVKIYGWEINGLFASNINLTNLDVTNCSKLKTLWCDSNKLTSLDVTKNLFLRNLYCGSNNITSLDLSKNTTLQSIQCSYTLISELDLNNNNSLIMLFCDHNKIYELNLSKNINLEYLQCNSNNIETLNLTNNTKLEQIFLGNNKLSAIDLSNNNALFRLSCSINKLKFLDLSKNSSLKEVDCIENQLTFTTLPAKNTYWTKYYYSPQAKFPLPKFEYAINEKIDLSSQLVAGGNTTMYKWKTRSGVTLVKNVDYTENNGFFVFLKAYSDSVYCEMTNATFPELTLITKNIATYLSLPTISMVSASAIGSNFFFDISAKENTPITVDFGNGLLSNYTMGINSSRIEGKLIGDTIKVWGVDIEYISISWMELTSLNVSNALNLKSLHCNFNQLTSLDISKNIQLDHLYCNNNQLESLDLSNNTNLQYVYNQNNYLTFATLPLINSSWFDFSYSPQFPIKMEKAEYSIGETLDLSSQLSVNVTVTTYAWVTSSGNTLTKDVDYVENNGKFTFLKGQTETIYCQMTNATFPSLTLETEAISVTLTSPSITLSTTLSTGNTFAFIASASDDNTYVIVDWGNGSTTNHTIGVNESSISGTLAGNTVKVYGSGITMLNVESKNLSELNISGASSLQKLLCNNNQLVTLDISKNDKLQHLDCRQNRIETLDLSKNILLESLFCSNNEISLLSVLNNPAINVLRCESNRFKISTLPLKQNSWTTYSYSPQAKVELPKKQYDLTETVDLGSELTVDGKTTNYIWKTKGGAALMVGTDYNETNGITTFLKVQTDSVYCQMTNSTFPDLTLTTDNISVVLFEPILSFTTLAPSASQQTIILKANSNNSNVKVDWGNGILTDNTVGTNSTNITGTLAGSTVKVYGLGITYADLSNKKINAIEIKSSILAYVDCKSNDLTFYSLPLKQQNWATYSYSPQNDVKLAKKQYGLTETVDLSSELTIDGKTTSYIWKTKGGATLVAGTDFNVNNGITTFLKVQPDSVYCQMSNATFPDLTLSTTNIKVSQFPLSVTKNKVAVKVYPNPASDNFSVEMAEEIVKVEVYTITGVKVFENSLYSSTKVSVPLTNMPKGTLIVRAFTRNGVYESKVIKI